jgi:hypothetical protein
MFEFLKRSQRPVGDHEHSGDHSSHSHGGGCCGGGQHGHTHDADEQAPGASSAVAQESKASVEEQLPNP